MQRSWPKARFGADDIFSHLELIVVGAWTTVFLTPERKQHS